MTYEGETRPLRVVLAAARMAAGASLDELIKRVAAHLLEPALASATPTTPPSPPCATP